MSIEVQRAELQRILRSPQFRRATKLRRLLELICEYHFENKPGEITEYLLATVAFGKGEHFDPAEDSLVRVQAREVRRRLREYYQNEGRSSPIVLDIPTGSYSPVFTTAEPPAPVRRMPVVRTAWTMLTATGLACAALLLAANHERRVLLESTVSAAGNGAGVLNPPLSNLWNRFLDSEVATVLVVSNPNIGGCAVSGGKRNPGGDCVEEYTGMGEAVAIHLFTNLFRAARHPLIVKPSRMVNEDDIKRYNLILLGGKQVNIWTDRLGPDLNLKPEPQSLTSDQAAQYSTAFDPQTHQLTRDRGIISLRRDATGRWVMILYGKHSQGTRAAAEASADPRFLSQLRWPRQPFPDAFRVLVGVTVNDGIPQEPVPVAVRVP